MTTLTVTATQSGSTFNGINLRVKVLTSAQTGSFGNTGSQSAVSTTASQAAITTTQTGSQVYFAIQRGEGTVTFTAVAGSTLFDNINDGTNGITYGSGRTTSATGTPGPATVGSSAPNTSVSTGAAALEVLPNGTITEDGSAPAVATNTSGTSVATSSFTPPAGSLLVAMVSSAGNTGVVTIAVSGGGLTWTEQVKGNTAGNDYAGVWTAVVPGGATAPVPPGRAMPGPTWERYFRHPQQPSLGYQTGSSPTSGQDITGTGSLTAAGSKGGSGASAISGTGLVVPGPFTFSINPGTQAGRAAPGRTWRRQFQHPQQPPGLPPGPAQILQADAISGMGVLTAAGAKNAIGVSAITGTGVVAAPAAAIVQQVTGSSTFDYGLSTATMTSTAGNTLIVLAGWDLSSQATSAAMPAVYVTDSAGNYWRHVQTSSSSVTGSRTAAWVCVNALPIQWVSVSLSTFASSLAYTVLEVSGLPAYFSLDLSAANSVSAGTSLAVSPGSAVSSDIAFTVLTAGASGLAAPSTPSGWAALTSVTSGAGSANPVTIYPFWDSSLAPGTSANITWTAAQSAPLSGVTFALNLNPPVPVQPNPNFPIVKAEAAFGYTPGDPSQPPPTWTDISSRIIGKDGSAFASSVMGREYELAQMESGELHLDINNQDGAFTPGNASSPYASLGGATLGTPVQLSAFWQNRWYHVGFGYVERWPQEWPDLPQWGISRMIATDAVSVMASATMLSALDADILLDAPYTFLEGAEQYTTFQNGINPTFTSADAQGLLAANSSRVNQRAAFYVDGLAAVANTGGTTSMLGDPDTGFGTTSISTAPTTPSSGPGVVYTDPAMPDPLSANGVTVEFWLVIPETVPSAQLQPVVFSAYGPASNYSVTHPSLQVQIDNFTGSNTLTVTLADGTTITAPFSASANSQQIVLTVTSASLNIYVNGGLAGAASLTAAQTTAWNAVTFGCPNYAYQAGSIGVGNYTAFDCALYPYQLPVQRVLSHYVTGVSGQQNVDATTRMAQVLAWANLGFARAGQQTFNGIPVPLTEGPAYSLEGQSAADAMNQVAVNEAGLVFAAPSGALVFVHKWALFNQQPVAVLGDSPNVSAGQVPYLQAATWDLDNTYLFNVTQTTQQVGANTTITASAANFASQASYFTRSALQQTIQTTSSLDAFDSANYSVAKYAQPQLRVSAVTIDAASNPQVAFPVVLMLQQGQVLTVTRTPVGGAQITGQVIIQKIQHDIGPTYWRTSLQLSPYSPENAILQLDTPTYDVLGQMGLA